MVQQITNYLAKHDPPECTRAPDQPRDGADDVLWKQVCWQDHNQGRPPLMAEVGEATGEIVERARLQAARLDDFLVSAAHKVEATSELLQQKVFSPMRRIRALVTALNAGLSMLRSNRPHRRTNGEQVEDEEAEDDAEWGLLWRRRRRFI